MNTADHGDGKDVGKSGRTGSRKGLDELRAYVESLDAQAYLASGSIDSLMETRALNAISGKKGFNVEGGIAGKAGKCGICGERIEIGDYVRSLIVLESRKRARGGYPGMSEYPFHDECATRLFLYMFPQALLAKVLAMEDFDESMVDAVYDPEARKELIEEVIDYYFEEGHGEGCDCGDCR